MESNKIYYSMGEVCEMFDVSHSLVRHWCCQFDTIKPVRNNKGNRLFTKSDIEKFKQIYHLVKERGMTIDGARRAMKVAPAQQMSELEKSTQILERLQVLKAKLLELKSIVKDNGSPVEEPYEATIEEYPQEDIDIEQDQVLNISRARMDSDREPDATDKELFAFYEQRLF